MQDQIKINVQNLWEILNKYWEKIPKKKKIEISINRGLSYEKMEKYIERKSYWHFPKIENHL